MVEIGYAIGEVGLHKSGKWAIMMTLSKQCMALFRNLAMYLEKDLSGMGSVA